MERIICEVQPRLVLVENSPMLTSRGLGRVLGGLAGMGMDAKWGVFRASSVGAAHHRARLFMVAYPHGTKLESLDIPKPPGVDTKKSRRRQFARAIDAALPADDYSSMSRDPDDVARGMDGLKATGNGWVPRMAARAVHLLTHNAI
jgi:DNA (cytosine-5)-methyltransferase 1